MSGHRHQWYISYYSIRSYVRTGPGKADKTDKALETICLWDKQDLAAKNCEHFVNKHPPERPHRQFRGESRIVRNPAKQLLLTQLS